MLDLPVTDPLSPVQILGYIAALIGVIGFLQTSDFRMRLIVTIMGCLNIIHFIMLGAYVGAANTALATSRAGLSMFEGIRRQAHFVVPSYVIISGGFLYFTYQQPADYFPFMATIIGSYAFFCLDGYKLRLGIACGGLCWLIHNVMVLSYGPTMMEICLFTINTTMAWRLYKKSREHEAPKLL